MAATGRDDVSPLVTGSGISRRAFVGAGLAGGAALASGGWRTLPGTATTLGGMAPPSDALWLEKSIPQLQSLLASGALM